MAETSQKSTRRKFLSLDSVGELVEVPNFGLGVVTGIKRSAGHLTVALDWKLSDGQPAKIICPPSLLRRVSRGTHVRTSFGKGTVVQIRRGKSRDECCVAKVRLLRWILAGKSRVDIWMPFICSFALLNFATATATFVRDFVCEDRRRRHLLSTFSTKTVDTNSIFRRI